MDGPEGVRARVREALPGVAGRAQEARFGAEGGPVASFGDGRGEEGLGVPEALEEAGEPPSGAPAGPEGEAPPDIGAGRVAGLPSEASAGDREQPQGDPVDGESFAMKHAIGDIEQFKSEIDLLSSLAHPNVQSYMYVFSDEEKKECFMVMELMSKDLSSHIKEVCCARRRVPFPPLVAVDIMLQIARGMSYLHSRGIYHGDLNPRNILVKSRSSSPEGYMLAKIANVGASPVKNSKPAAANQAAGSPCIWYAPEVLSEQEQAGAASANGTFKYTEKADVYSFAMVCFELLTGKVPFDENHLQGDKMSRNIKADVRPLFPFPSPKCLVSLTKRCWQSEPTQRPSFASICRMLRYIKRFLVLNPDNGQPELPAPPLDYFDIETNLSRRFPSWIKEGRSGVGHSVPNVCLQSDGEGED
ncbi:putative serine/threonine-protein kinase roco7 [Iris pallida]|uniref:Serine/threonine-protein kinase roco7 n=1 Tax=Iris pallida TaxID=29817 RepID=A0AAX6GJS0_IRIPA|nr:putative serine/threonine-protein kinase roco7 [Iris pallida]